MTEEPLIPLSGITNIRRTKDIGTEYQIKVRERLASICGYPNLSIKLRDVGLPLRVFIWDIGKKNYGPRRNEILVMADRAQEIGMQVYRLKKIPHPNNQSMFQYEVTYKNEEVRRVTVWCPEEAHKE